MNTLQLWLLVEELKRSWLLCIKISYYTSKYPWANTVYTYIASWELWCSLEGNIIHPFGVLCTLQLGYCNFFCSSLFHWVSEGIRDFFSFVLISLWRSNTSWRHVFRVGFPRGLVSDDAEYWVAPWRRSAAWGREQCRTLESARLPPGRGRGPGVGGECPCPGRAPAIAPLWAHRLLFSSALIGELRGVVHLRFGLLSLCAFTSGFKRVFVLGGRLLPLSLSTLLWTEVWYVKTYKISIMLASWIVLSHTLCSTGSHN